MKLVIYYCLNDSINTVVDNNNNILTFQDLSSAFVTAKTMARNNPAIIFSIVNIDTGEIIVDFQ